MSPESAQTSADSCVPVAKGFYSFAGASEALKCPPNYYCPGGTALRACLPFFHAPAGSASCMATGWIFAFVPAMVIVGAVIIVLAVLLSRGYFSSSLASESSSAEA